MAKVVFHGTCKDGFQLTTEAFGETLGLAETNGNKKIDIVCESHGGTKRNDRPEPVRSLSPEPAQD
jgi:hypothetical protein